MRTKTAPAQPFVLLDLDNTILDFNTAERTALGRAFETLRLPFSEEIAALYSRINIRHWEMLENGLLTREQVLVRRFEALFQELQMSADAFQAQELYENNLCEGHWFMPGAQELLERLSGSCRLFICSNGSQAVQDRRIESAGIAPYFEKIFISEHMGSNKPEKRFFDACFAQIPGFQARRAVIVGDSLTSDIRGGINAGIRTCWYNPRGLENTGCIEPDHEIRRLGELPALLETLFR